MGTRLGIGVIGMGWMGTVHARSYRLVPDRFPDAEVEPHFLVCADNVEQRARDAAARYGFERYTTDWREVVEDPAVNVVTIATQNALHKEIALAAVAAGKHVFCENTHIGRCRGA